MSLWLVDIWGGKYAFQWLHIPPKAARWGHPNINFPGHLFDIALRLRMGLPLKDRMQGNRKCRCKAKGANMGEARWDPHGTHLSAGCHTAERSTVIRGLAVTCAYIFTSGKKKWGTTILILLIWVP